MLGLNLTLQKFVDDLALAFFDSIENILYLLPRMLRHLFRLLRDLGLEPSLDADGKCGKSVVLVSHAALEKALVPLIENFGLHFDARARNLGIDHHGQGRALESSVQAKRCEGVRLRGLKLLNLKKVGG